jgi:hypothetical protein
MIDLDSLAAFELWFGAPLAPGLRTFLTERAGHAAHSCLLYALSELEERNETYETRTYCPGFVTIGDDGGGGHRGAPRATSSDRLARRSRQHERGGLLGRGREPRRMARVWLSARSTRLVGLTRSRCDARFDRREWRARSREGVGLDLDEHPVGDELLHLDHRGRGARVPEGLRVRTADGLPVPRDVGDEHARAHDAGA